MNVFDCFRTVFGQRIDSKHSRGNFFPIGIYQKKFQLKIPIFSKSDDNATWWPNSYKIILTCGQLRNIQRYQKYVWLVQAFSLEFHTYSSQQCTRISVYLEIEKASIYLLITLFTVVLIWKFTSTVSWSKSVNFKWIWHNIKM